LHDVYTISKLMKELNLTSIILDKLFSNPSTRCHYLLHISTLKMEAVLC